MYWCEDIEEPLPPSDDLTLATTINDRIVKKKLKVENNILMEIQTAYLCKNKWLYS